MSLDLDKIAPQIEGMVERLVQGSGERAEHLEQALSTLRDQSSKSGQLKKRIEASVGRTTWLVAGLVNGLDGHYLPPPAPKDFTVIATDGSQIDVDRHRRARCYLINTGAVTLTYGEHSDASLMSFPRLYSSDEDMVITPPEGGTRRWPVEGPLLGIRRSVEECRRLAEFVNGLPSGSSALALIDGSLILWGLVRRDIPDFVIEAMLHKGFIAAMEEMRNKAIDKNLALASYISFPRSADVVNALRVALCPHEHPDCDQYCNDILPEKQPCAQVSQVQDSDLFNSLLREGERSELFASTSSIVRNHYPENQRVYFFYLKLEDEIARVEVPEWVARDERRLGLAHSLILDQCLRGQGYPVALSEAHEQAVITTADRENFWLVAESYLEHEGLPTTGSAKDMSKRTRWV